MFSLLALTAFENNCRAIGVLATGDWTRGVFSASWAMLKRALTALFWRLLRRLCSAALGRAWPFADSIVESGWEALAWIAPRTRRVSYLARFYALLARSAWSLSP